MERKENLRNTLTISIQRLEENSIKPGTESLQVIMSQSFGIEGKTLQGGLLFSDIDVTAAAPTKPRFLRLCVCTKVTFSSAKAKMQSKRSYHSTRQVVLKLLLHGRWRRHNYESAVGKA